MLLRLAYTDLCRANIDCVLALGMLDCYNEGCSASPRNDSSPQAFMHNSYQAVEQ